MSSDTMETMFEVVHDHDCPYIPGNTAKTDYRLMERCPPEDYEQLLARGWRRFGCTFFRPICASCLECRSLRLDVENFRPTRSMRRNWRKNQDIQVVLRQASMTVPHLRLYGRYHEDMADRRQWNEKAISAGTYYQTFVEGQNDYGYELLYLLDERLIAVALVDILPSAMSAVYCYYDPEFRSRGLGVYSVLKQAELAKRRSIPHLYLGYWIESNASMRYKARYAPHEILRGRPASEDVPDWGAAELSVSVDV